MFGSLWGSLLPCRRGPGRRPMLEDRWRSPPPGGVPAASAAWEASRWCHPEWRPPRLLPASPPQRGTPRSSWPCPFWIIAFSLVLLKHTHDRRIDKLVHTCVRTYVYPTFNFSTSNLRKWVHSLWRQHVIVLCLLTFGDEACCLPLSAALLALRMSRKRRVVPLRVSMVLLLPPVFRPSSAECSEDRLHEQ